MILTLPGYITSLKLDEFKIGSQAEIIKLVEELVSDSDPGYVSI